jgi:hypothetical protein
MATAPVQLDYTSPATDAQPRHRRSIWWTILAIPTLIIPFVPFGCDVSPASVLYKVATDLPVRGTWSSDGVMITILAAGLCYGALACIWRVLRRWGDRNQVVRVLGVSIGGVGVVIVVVMLALFLYAFLRATDMGKSDWAAFGVCAAALLGSAWLLWVIYCRRRVHLVLGSLLAPFITCGTFCLIDFFGDRRIGWDLTLFSVPVSAVELIVLAYFPASELGQKETAGQVRPTALVSSSTS